MYFKAVSMWIAFISLPFSDSTSEFKSSSPRDLSFGERAIFCVAWSPHWIKLIVYEKWSDKNTVKCLILIAISSDQDATGRPPSGLLLGNLGWLGSYSECTKVIVDAHYCLAFIDVSSLRIILVSSVWPVLGFLITFTNWTERLCSLRTVEWYVISAFMFVIMLVLLLMKITL